MRRNTHDAARQWRSLCGAALVSMAWAACAPSGAGEVDDDARRDSGGISGDAGEGVPAIANGGPRPDSTSSDPLYLSIDFHVEALQLQPRHGPDDEADFDQLTKTLDAIAKVLEKHGAKGTFLFRHFYPQYNCVRYADNWKTSPNSGPRSNTPARPGARAASVHG
jgi:hypothetical protein